MSEYQHVKFTIEWHSFDNKDIGEDRLDEGWFVDVETPDGKSHQIGPDYYGPGLQTFEHALDLCRKWATQRGFQWSEAHSFEFTVGRKVEAPDRDCMILSNGECVADVCSLHGPKEAGE